MPITRRISREVIFSMPENKDTQNTTDSGRSGGRQTTAPDKGDEVNWSPGQATASNIKPGYGSDTGQQGTGAAAQLSADQTVESGGPDGQFKTEEKRRTLATETGQEETGQQWSPGSDQPKS
jgi:hypothetical protein